MTDMLLPEGAWGKLRELTDSLGLPFNDLAEMTIEPWGISAWIYLRGHDGLRYVDDDTHRVAREHHFFPRPLDGVTR